MIKERLNYSPDVSFKGVHELSASWRIGLCAEGANFFHFVRNKVDQNAWLACSVAIRGQHAFRKRSHSFPQSHASFIFYSYFVKLRSKIGYGMLPADCCLHKPMPLAFLGMDGAYSQWTSVQP